MDPTISVAVPENHDVSKPIEVPVKDLDFAKFIPEGVGQKDYMKKIDGFDSLFKSFDNAQTMLGQRPKFSAPGDDASEEEREAFWNSLRPEKAEDYEFEVDESIPENLRATEEFQIKMKQLLHDNRIPKSMSKGLQKGFDAIMMEMHKAREEENVKAFNTLKEKLTEVYGKDNFDKKVTRGNAVIGMHVPDNLKPLVEQAVKESEAASIIMSYFGNKVADEYMDEDKIPTGDGAIGGSKEDLRSEGVKLIAEREKIKQENPLDPRIPDLTKKIDAIYDKVGSMS